MAGSARENIPGRVLSLGLRDRTQYLRPPRVGHPPRVDKSTFAVVPCFVHTGALNSIPVFFPLLLVHSYSTPAFV